MCLGKSRSTGGVDEGLAEGLAHLLIDKGSRGGHGRASRGGDGTDSSSSQTAGSAGYSKFVHVPRLQLTQSVQRRILGCMWTAQTSLSRCMRNRGARRRLAG